MNKTTKILGFYSLLIFLLQINFSYALESFESQEVFLESQLDQATSSEQIAKITLALSQIKKQQSKSEYNKLPEMIGRDRSFLSSSVRDSFSYRQMASSFKEQPGVTSIAYSYRMGNILGFCCALLGFVVLGLRLRYRY